MYQHREHSDLQAGEEGVDVAHAGQHLHGAVAVGLGQAGVQDGLEADGRGVAGRDVEAVVHGAGHGVGRVHHHPDAGAVQDVGVDVVDAVGPQRGLVVVQGDDEGQPVLRPRGVHQQLLVLIAPVEGEAVEVVAVEGGGEVGHVAGLLVELAVDEEVLQVVADVDGLLAQVLVEGPDGRQVRVLLAELESENAEREKKKKRKKPVILLLAFTVGVLSSPFRRVACVSRVLDLEGVVLVRLNCCVVVWALSQFAFPLSVSVKWKKKGSFRLSFLSPGLLCSL